MKQSILKVNSSLNKFLFNKLRQLSTEGIKVKPHIPLIKFRKGETTQLNQVNSSSTLNVQSSTSLDETMTPIKYRRKTLSELEMNVIEQGGCY